MGSACLTGAAAVKVLLYALGGTSPMARIVSLVVPGVTFRVRGFPVPAQAGFR